MFGLTEKQFRRTFQKQRRFVVLPAKLLLRLLECRLDNVVYSMGLAKTRRAALQFVTHGHVKLMAVRLIFQVILVNQEMR
jgi:small subunit ribosomal protein S4